MEEEPLGGFVGSLLHERTESLKDCSERRGQLLLRVYPTSIPLGSETTPLY